jgi:hypothetical protein
MGEAKRKAALRERLGETRGDGFDDFNDEIARLRATPGAREDQLDRLRFHELFTVALVEGCRERGGEETTAERDLQLIEASCLAAGACITATFLGRLDAPPDKAVEIIANTIIQNFASGVMLSAQHQSLDKEAPNA